MVSGLGWQLGLTSNIPHGSLLPFSHESTSPPLWPLAFWIISASARSLTPDSLFILMSFETRDVGTIMEIF